MNFLGRQQIERGRGNRGRCLSIAAAVLFLSAAASGALVGPFVIAKGGQAAAVIVIDEAAPFSAQKAASELARYVMAMTGARMPVTNAPVAGLATIRVGAPTPDDGMDEIDLSVTPDGELSLTGGGSRAPVYAVYKFLETLGVRYWSPWRETVPESKDLSVPGDFRLRYRPPFAWRSGWSLSDCGNWEASFAWRFKVGHNSLNRKEYGGHYQYSNSESMTFRWLNPKTIVDPPKRTGGDIEIDPDFDKMVSELKDDIGEVRQSRFITHPDWYALVGGQRVPHQICATSKDGLGELVAEVRAYLKANPGIQYVSLVSNDNDQFCRCAGCVALRKELDGGNMALEASVANHVARALADEFPSVKFTILAYWTKERAPKRLLLEPNVSVCLAMGHPQNLPVTKCAVWREKAEEWERLAPGRISIWDYYAGFNNFNEPRADFFNIGETMRYYRDHGYMGVSAQLALGRTANFGELKAYLWAQMAWNPDQDESKIIDEYIDANYGAGAPFVREYWGQNLRLMRETECVKMGMYGMNYDAWYKAPEMLRAWELIHKALDATKGDKAAHEQCEILYVSILGDFLLRWKRQDIDAALKRRPDLMPRPDRAAILAECEALVAKYRPGYWSEKLSWADQFEKFRQETAPAPPETPADPLEDGSVFPLRTSGDLNQ